MKTTQKHQEGAIDHFTNDNTTDSLKFKEEITGQTGNDDKESFEVMMLLKCVISGECLLLIVKYVLH